MSAIMIKLFQSLMTVWSVITSELVQKYTIILIVVESGNNLFYYSAMKTVTLKPTKVFYICKVLQIRSL